MMKNMIMKYLWVITVSALCILMVGCRVSTTPISPSITEQATDTETVLPTNTSELVLLTKTATNTPAVQTVTMSPTSTATIKPTLNANEIEELIHQLLRTNGDCSLPCFWGIEPNETSYEYAELFFRHLGRKGFTRSDENGNIYHYDTSFGVNAEEGYVNIVIKMGVESETITSLEVYIGDFENVDQSIWQVYSLQSVLQTLGIPSEVRFLVEEPHIVNSDYVSYAYILVYDDPDVIVFYVMGSIDDGSTYEICPLNPKDNPSYLWLFLGKDYSEDFSEWVELTQATTMTNEDFYDFFVDGTVETCMTLNAEAFSNKP